MGLFSRWAALVPVLPRAVEGINFSVFLGHLFIKAGAVEQE